MNSRMNKYYDSKMENENGNKLSRTKKNQELYKEVSSLELEDFDLNSNVSVIGNNSESINIDEIKDILDKKYHEKPKKKSFGDTAIELAKINLDETREYDINSILEKAKEKKEVNYEEDRLKKLRNTQYDILKNLNIFDKEDNTKDGEKINKDQEYTSKANKAEKELQDLIDTITAKELIRNEEELTVSGELDPLDILSDLRGDDDATRVMGMLTEKIEEAEQEQIQAPDVNKDIYLEDTLGIEDTQINTVNSDENEAEDDDGGIVTEPIGETRTDIIPLSERKKLEDSCAYLKFDDTRTRLGLESALNSKTTSFSKSDFDDFYDLKEDMHITKIIIKILIVVIVIVFIIGLVILANKFLQLGLF